MSDVLRPRVNPIEAAISEAHEMGASDVFLRCGRGSFHNVDGQRMVTPSKPSPTLDDVADFVRTFAGRIEPMISYEIDSRVGSQHGLNAPTFKAIEPDTEEIRVSYQRHDGLDVSIMLRLTPSRHF